MTLFISTYIGSKKRYMIDLFFIVFYIKLRTFSNIKLYITFNRKRSKYYHKKKNFESEILSPDGLARRKKQIFFHLFPKILTIVVSTSTWSQNEGKYLYFMGMKEFCLKVILYTDYIQYYVTQVRNFDTCLYISENKCTSPLKTMYGTFFF